MNVSDIALYLAVAVLCVAVGALLLVKRRPLPRGLCEKMGIDEVSAEVQARKAGSGVIAVGIAVLAVGVVQLVMPDAGHNPAAMLIVVAVFILVSTLLSRR